MDHLSTTNNENKIMYIQYIQITLKVHSRDCTDDLGRVVVQPSPIVSLGNQTSNIKALKVAIVRIGDHSNKRLPVT